MRRFIQPNRLATRIGAVFAVAVASLVLAIAIWGYGMDEARRELAYIRTNIQPIVVATNRMLNALEQMENAEFLYFLEDTPRSGAISQFDRNAAEFEHWFTRAEEIVQGAPAETQLRGVRESYRKFLITDGRIRQLLNQGQSEAAERLNLDVSMHDAERLRQAVRDLRAFKLRQIEIRIEAAERALAVAEWTAIGVAALGIVAGALLWRRTWRLLGEPLLAILEGTRQAARMDFRPVAHPAAGKTLELAELQDSFNAMQAHIQATTAELEKAREALEDKVARRTADLEAANRRLGAMVEDLKAVDKLRSDLFAVVSHELLTPINFITGHGSLLEDGVLGPLNSRQQAAIKAMLGGAQRLTRMVRNMLEFTQISRGIAVRKLEADYGDVVKAVASAVKDLAEAKHQALQVDIPDSLPAALADPDRCGQVLSELLYNAIEFTPEAGTIRVEVRFTDDEIITAVTDTGPGIPEHILDRITEPFYQADLSSTRQHGGLGLGLAIVKHLVERMGGTLAIETRLGRGSTFRFTLPRYGSALAKAREGTQAGQEGLAAGQPTAD